MKFILSFVILIFVHRYVIKNFHFLKKTSNSSFTNKISRDITFTKNVHVSCIGFCKCCVSEVLDSPSVLESDSCESKLPPSQRFSRRVAIVDLEQYVKTGLLSGELQRQHEVSGFQLKR